MQEFANKRKDCMSCTAQSFQILLCSVHVKELLTAVTSRCFWVLLQALVSRVQLHVNETHASKHIWTYRKQTKAE